MAYRSHPQFVEELMWVTCYTDASWHGSGGVGGIAYWLRSVQGRIVESASCPPEVTCNNTAELAAVLAGVQHALSSWSDVEGIQVNTDSMVVIDYLKFGADVNRLRRKDWVASFRTKLYVLLDEKNCKLQIKHVKGHQRPENMRFYLNGRVDALAGKKSRNGMHRTGRSRRQEPLW